jgi:hypothetical protein
MTTTTTTYRVNILNERDDFGEPIVNRVISASVGHVGRCDIDPASARRMAADLIAAADELDGVEK